MFKINTLKPFSSFLLFSKRFSTTKKDYYAVLGLERNVTQEQIKKEFHKLAKMHHPDSAESSGDHEKFKEISEAYNIIGDVEKRAKYDSDLNLQAQNEQKQKQQYSSSYSAQYPHQSQGNYRKRSLEEEQEYQKVQQQQKWRDKDEEEQMRQAQSQHQTEERSPAFELFLIGWLYLIVYPEKKKMEQMSQIDEKFEYSQPRGRISLKSEDIYGLSLKQLDEVDKSGKYILPPKAKASVEEYRSLFNLTMGNIPSTSDEVEKQNLEIQQNKIWDNSSEDSNDQQKQQDLKSKLKEQKAINNKDQSKKQKYLETEENNNIPQLQKQENKSQNDEKVIKKSTFNYAQRFAKIQSPQQQIIKEDKEEGREKEGNIQINLKQ